MNNLVLDVYKALGRPHKRLFHFPYILAYAGGKVFDLASFITGRRFPISSIRVRKFCENTYFTSTAIKATDFTAPVSLEEGLKRTIEWEFLGGKDKSREIFYNRETYDYL